MKFKNSFAGGCIDTDSDLRNILPNRYRYALNCLSGNTEGVNGSITNRKGNTLISFSLPQGINKVVGSCADIQRNAVVYFVKNSLQKHCILRYNIKQRSIDRIVWENKYLNFQDDVYITSINIIGNLLYWTDGWFNKFTYDYASMSDFKDSGFNPPRKIDMLKAYNYTNGVVCADNEKYTAITQEVMDRIKAPPLKPIECNFIYDPSVGSYNLSGKEYQVAYRYTYDNAEKSVLSTYSKVAHSYNQYNIYGQTTNNATIDNAIQVKLYNGNEIVKSIDILVRDGETSDWYLIKTINNYSDKGTVINQPFSLLTYNITGTEIFLPVNQAEIVAPFDNIGQVVDQSTIISENHLVDGGITENYDNVDTDTVLSWQINNLNYTSAQIQLTNTILTDQSTTKQISLDFNQFQSYTSLNLYNIILTIRINKPNGQILREYTFSYNVSENDATSFTSFRTSFISALNSYIESVRRAMPTTGYDMSETPFSAPPVEVGNPIINIIYNSDYDSDTFGSVFVNLYMLDLKTTIQSSFKDGFTHELGLVYYDRADRKGGTNYKKSTTYNGNVYNGTSIYIPFVTEIEAHQGISFPEIKYWTVDWEIKHTPPEWATHYQWVYKKNTPDFLQFYYTNAVLDSSGNIKITDLNTQITNFRNTFPNNNIKNYTWQKGDRIRFIGLRKFTYNQTFYFQNYKDVEILSQLTTGDIILQDFGYTQYNVNPTSIGWDYMLVEIYTPQSQSSEFFEIGEKYEILNPHTDLRSHQGSPNGQDQTLLQSAKGTFLFGDVYTRLRYTNPSYWQGCASKYYSDYYLGVENDYGRVNTIIPDIKRQKYNILRWSQRYLPDTQINGLSTFPFLNKEDMNDMYGGIYGIRQVGQTLKVLQEKKNTSFYIAIQELSTALGNAIPVISTDRLFSKANPSEMSYGTKNPESVVVSNRYLFFYDINTGEIVRDAANGMFALGKYDALSGIKTYLNAKQEELLNADKYAVISTVNTKYNEVWFTFISERKGIKNCETIVYNEILEKFTTWLSYYREDVQNTQTVILPLDYFAFNGQALVSFFDGQVWVENDNSEYNKIFGHQKPQIITPVFNSDQEKVKILLSLGISTNNNNYNKSNTIENWSAEVTIPETEAISSGQKTLIYPNFFKQKEEAIYSDMPRNILSKKSGSTLYKLINGDVMRGQAAEIKLTNESNKEVEIYSVITNYINSEKSK